MLIKIDFMLPKLTKLDTAKYQPAESRNQRKWHPVRGSHFSTN